MLALGACDRADGAAANEVMARVRVARNRACACKDVGCAATIEQKLAVWRHANQARLDLLSSSTPAYRAKLTALGDEISECVAQLRVASEREPVPAATMPEPAPEPRAEPQPVPVPGDVEPPPVKPTPAMLSAAGHGQSKI
jgi:hypothetical protein